MVTMFLRWKKKNEKRYGYLEERQYIDGKVVSKNIAYLGTMELAKGRLLHLLNDGIINQDQFTKFSEGLPDPKPEEPQKKTIEVSENEYTTMKNELETLRAENEELKSLLANHNQTMVREFTRAEMENFWNNEINGKNYHPEILQNAKKSYISGLFNNDSDTTKLFKGKRYTCPFTNKKYQKPDNLLKKAIDYLLQYHLRQYAKQQSKN